MRTTQIRLDEATKRATAAINARERAWNEEQSRKLAENDQKKAKKSQNASAYQARTLAKCKTCRGRCITA